MRFSLLTTALAALVAAAVASPTTNKRSALAKRSVVHETQPRAAATTWKRTARLHHDTVLPVRIGLRQQNLHRADAFLRDVSDPHSPNYGKHWTQQQVADTFAPAQEAIDAVLAWVQGELGRSSADVRLSRGRNWVAFNATVREVEALLRTEYHVYQHAGHGGRHVACDAYHVPAYLQEHIDIVTPTVHFDGPPGGVGRGAGGRRTKALPATGDDTMELMKKRTEEKRNVDADARFHAESLAKQGNVIVNALMSLDQCDTMITPACLRALYNMPQQRTKSAASRSSKKAAAATAAMGNSLGIVEYTPQAYLQSDLDLYFAQFLPALKRGTGPVVQLLDNGVVQTDEQSFSVNGESALDLEFAMALVYPQTTTLFQVGDTVQGASFNNLLDTLDGAYCTTGGGDDLTMDGNYSSALNCGTATPTNVLSTSYSYNEADLTAAYAQRQCNEYLKLGLQGITVVYSSGDFGVAGNGDTCIDTATGSYVDGSSTDTGAFNPSFPGTCPYVTSVGATQLPAGTSVHAAGAEVACQDVILSGGGFSNVFAMPTYQQQAVADYYTSGGGSAYNASRYNNSQTVRGYPDVSANGANYVTAVDGNFTLSYGTSASAPTFAAIINIINEHRLQAGKSPVGFINPALYANPDVLTDITNGTNPGCGTAGFAAVAGWDPVTGLGTPNYKAMLNMFMSLP